jgi:hypothetical protein
MRESRPPVRSHSNTSNNAANPVKSGTSTNQKDPILIRTIPCRTPMKKNITAKTAKESPVDIESLKSLLSRKSARHSCSLTAGNPPSTRAARTSPSERGTNQSRIRMIHMMHLPSSCRPIVDMNCKAYSTAKLWSCLAKNEGQLLSVTDSRQFNET